MLCIGETIGREWYRLLWIYEGCLDFAIPESSCSLYLKCLMDFLSKSTCFYPTSKASASDTDHFRSPTHFFYLLCFSTSSIESSFSIFCYHLDLPPAVVLSHCYDLSVLTWLISPYNALLILISFSLFLDELRFWIFCFFSIHESLISSIC